MEDIQVFKKCQIEIQVIGGMLIYYKLCKKVLKVIRRCGYYFTLSLQQRSFCIVNVIKSLMYTLVDCMKMQTFNGIINKVFRKLNSDTP